METQINEPDNIEEIANEFEAISTIDGAESLKTDPANETPQIEPVEPSESNQTATKKDNPIKKDYVFDAKMCDGLIDMYVTIVEIGSDIALKGSYGAKAPPTQVLLLKGFFRSYAKSKELNLDKIAGLMFFMLFISIVPMTYVDGLKKKRGAYAKAENKQKKDLHTHEEYSVKLKKDGTPKKKPGPKV